MSDRTQTDTEDIDVDVDAESPSLVAAALSNWIMYLLSIVMAVFAVVGYRYNLTVGPTDEILFTFLAVALFVIAIGQTLHLYRGG